MNHFRTLISLFFLLSPAITFALSPVPPPLDPQGPVVPCVDCDNLTTAPYPEAGLWSNPELSPGSGLNFEIQNGVLAGYIYTYTTEGQPEWYIISGPLVRSDKEGVMWELTTKLNKVEGGSCLGCEFTPPDQITEGYSVNLEFMQRNYLRLRIADTQFGGPIEIFHQFFVPFMYGSVGKAYFAPQTPYIFPEFSVDSSPRFILSFRPSAAAENSQWNGMHIYLEAAVQTQDISTDVAYSLRVLDPHATPADSDDTLGFIICSLDTETEQPSCVVEIDGVSYQMPIANLGDTRFYAEAQDGSIIEGFRIDYD